MFGFLFGKKNKQIDAFAISLADEFYSQVQPEVISEYISDKKGKAAKKVERQLRESVTRIQQFRGSNKLGVYGKARLHLTFTERLEELGYNKDVAKKINELILIKTP